MKIYTKKGDEGKTTNVSGEKISKSSPIINAIGSVDELNAIIGVVISICKYEKIIKILSPVQSDLFVLGGEIIMSEQGEKNKIRISKVKIEALETIIDELVEKMPELHSFILPGGGILSANMHLARTITRRAERDVVRFMEKTGYKTLAQKYLNRLSDLFFVLARYSNFLDKREDVKWQL